MSSEPQPDIIGEFTRGQGFVVGLCVIIVTTVLEFWGEAGTATAAGISVLAVISAIIIFKPLWQRAWFWAAIGIIAIAHSAAVWLISWPDGHLYGVELVPIIFADVAAIIGLIWILHKLVARLERG